ncbi:TPA: hypothetical protein VLM68_000991 [Streptococcus pyogenes]|uniref:Phage protein n=1 Tax=Streptococcus dysgalactiae subsp. equisimilis TaxID=119602 RepID=A0A9X8T3W8_STREQ|nr:MULTISPECIES: hypothetical protein [Streptococcus]QBX14263.1 hypothetical protein Javan131_0048 [Streptococcus phage Javan131]QBX14839.1 hypothetical protein Javan157_0045 [Streptococcus phage Javan157]QBX28794.1 hypothetical protein Javan470_0012 [Streptococcus phage Javan470]QCK31833.1 hypothetical protein ETT69_03180 [Streptococcus pyogenes]SQG93696.1 phage protein [Streptococcus dysgalactiae subsp. equisimilis]
MDKTIKLDLSAIGEGGLQEKVDKELEKVFDNILDPNTDIKTKRKLTITLTMVPDETREVVSTSMEVKSSLAPQTGVATTVLVGQKDGKVYANELKSKIPGQTYFDEEATLRTDIGQPIDDLERGINEDVIDFNKQKKVGN